MTENGAPPTIVVVVVSWNTRDLLGQCLRSLAPSHQEGLTEVWVVDNGSEDGSPEMVRREFPWVRLVETGENLGYGRAINLAAQCSDSPWIAISNADVALERGALPRLLHAGEQLRSVAVVAPRLILPDGRTQHSVWAFPTVRATLAQNLGTSVLPRRLGERLALREAWDPDRSRPVPWAVGAFLLIRRAAFAQVGGFDSSQWMSAEDLDLGWRLHRAGWRTWYEPGSRALHKESSATTQVWGEALPVHWQRCAYAWQVRTMGRPRTVWVGLINLLGSSIRLAGMAARRAAGRPIPLRPQARWTAVHAYALAPRRVLARYR